MPMCPCAWLPLTCAPHPKSNCNLHRLARHRPPQSPTTTSPQRASICIPVPISISVSVSVSVPIYLRTTSETKLVRTCYSDFFLLRSTVFPPLSDLVLQVTTQVFIPCSPQQTCVWTGRCYVLLAACVVFLLPPVRLLACSPFVPSDVDVTHIMWSSSPPPIL